MSERKYDAEPYDRRTRAIEQQAMELGRIADALTASALAQAAATKAPDNDGSYRAWTASSMMNRLSAWVDRIAPRQ